MTPTTSVLAPVGPSRDQERLAEQERLLTELSELLIVRETELASSRAELERFRIAYLRRFVPLYAEHDALEAQIWQHLAVDADLGAARTWSRRARARAAASEQVARGAGAPADQEDAGASGAARGIDPDLRDLYRRAAKLLHPDTATTDDERARRTAVMAAVNDAYERGDAEAIQHILDGEVAQPEAGANDDLATRLATVMRMITHVRARLEAIERLRQILEADPMWRLFEQCRERWLAGEDPLADDEASIRSRIAIARSRLAALRMSTPTPKEADR